MRTFYLHLLFLFAVLIVFSAESRAQEELPKLPDPEWVPDLGELYDASKIGERRLVSLYAGDIIAKRNRLWELVSILRKETCNRAEAEAALHEMTLLFRGALKEYGGKEKREELTQNLSKIVREYLACKDSNSKDLQKIEALNKERVIAIWRLNRLLEVNQRIVVNPPVVYETYLATLLRLYGDDPDKLLDIYDYSLLEEKTEMGCFSESYGKKFRETSWAPQVGAHIIEAERKRKHRTKQGEPDKTSDLEAKREIRSEALPFERGEKSGLTLCLAFVTVLAFFIGLFLWLKIRSRRKKG